MIPLHLRYILGLDNEIPKEGRISIEYLKKKRELFLKNNDTNNAIIGHKIYSLMCPCFEQDNTGCTPIENIDEKPKKEIDNPSSTLKVVNSCGVLNSVLNPSHKRFIVSERIVRTEMKSIREFLKTIPLDYKWGAQITATGGGRPSVARTNDPNRFKVNRATLQEMKRIVRAHQKNK